MRDTCSRFAQGASRTLFPRLWDRYLVTDCSRRVLPTAVFRGHSVDKVGAAGRLRIRKAVRRLPRGNRSERICEHGGWNASVDDILLDVLFAAGFIGGTAPRQYHSSRIRDSIDRLTKYRRVAARRVIQQAG